MSFSFPRLPQRRGGMGEDPCNTRLSLGQGGLAEGVAAMNWGRGRGLQEQPARFHVLFPPCPKEEEYHEEGSKLRGEGLDAMGCRLRLGTADHEEDVVSGGGGSQADSNGGGRKKLRLSREQLDFLERSFRQQNTLTATQKQELAERLNLLPRQVEVWFQNKRARTKLKQTEVDCEFLKKCCESLSDENQRLKEELQELRSSKQAPPFHMQPPNTAKLTMCPDCEWAAATDGGTHDFGNDVAARANARSRGVPSNSSSKSFLGSLRK